MRKIVTAAFVSMDGVMQAPGGPDEDRTGGFELGGWTVPHFDEVVGKTMDELFAAPYELLLGRKTYDIFAAYWPHAESGPDSKIAEQFNRVTKYVATHRPESLGWHNSKSLGDDVVKTLRQLKTQDGPTLLTQGSSELIQLLLSHELVDEIRTIVFPVVLGKGKRLFGPAAAPAAFKLAKSTVSPSGLIIATYAHAGEVTTGSFA